MPVRIALVGCGEHSEIGHAVPLARYAKARPGAIELAAACDLRHERAQLFRQRYGFKRVYTKLTEMLSAEQVDVCISVAPVERIAEIGIKLLQAEVPCVVEKPLGASIAEVRELLEVSRSTNTPNMVSVNRRFMPLLNRAIEWQKKAGALHYVRATMLRHERTEPDFLRFTAIHALDTVRFIAGNFANTEIRPFTGMMPRWYAIDIQFEIGLAGRIDVLPTSGVVEETYELLGEGFRVIVTSPFGPQRMLRCYQQNRLVVEEIAGENTPEDTIFGFYGEVVELVEAISHQRRPKPSIEEIFPSVEACFELADQVESGPSIRILGSGPDRSADFRKG
jgi:predicted dehydrogenase